MIVLKQKLPQIIVTNTTRPIWVAISAVFLCLVCSIGCQNIDTTKSIPIPYLGKPLVHYTDIKVDSFVAYPLGENVYFHGQGYVFSPYERNKVWFTPENNAAYNEAFEIDLITGQKLLFSEKFNHQFFKKSMRFDGILQDSIDKNVCWFLNFHEGVFRYDFAARTGQLLDMASKRNAITTAAFSKNHVWIGTSSGLWGYDRHTGAFRAVDDSPEVWIRMIQIMPDGKLNIDGIYTYDPASNCWEKNQGGGSVYKSGYQDPVIALNLPAFGGRYQVATAPNETWYCNSTYWFFHTGSDSSLLLYKPPVSSRIYALQADSDNLYVLCQDSFLIVNKHYLSKSCAGDPALFSKIKRLNGLSDSLHLYESDPWPVRKQKMAFLKSVFPKETDRYLTAQIAAFSYYFTIPNDEDSLRTLLQTSGIDTILTDRIYQYLILKNVQCGKLLEAFNFTKELHVRRTKSLNSNEYNSDFEALKTCLHRLDSIDQVAQPNYENIFAKAGVMVYLCSSHSAFVGEACYNYSLSDSMYRRVVRMYPKSPRADDADYSLIISSHCYEGEDGSDNPEEVLQWKQFLLKYPDTDLRAQALCNMAWALSRELPDIRAGVKLMTEAERLRPDLFLEGRDDSRKWVKEEFMHLLNWFETDFSIQLRKRKIRSGEPVEMIFSVKNTGTSAKTMHGFIDAQFPNFNLDITTDEVGVSCVRPVTYLESKTSAHPQEESLYGDKTIDAGKTYVETWDLTKTAHKLQNPYMGRFVFDRPGTYVITGHWRFWGKNKESAAVQLIVE